MTDYLSFETKLAKIEGEILSLEQENSDNNISKLEKLRDSLKNNIEKTYSNLTPMDIVKVARHPERPHAIDYINGLFTEVIYIEGDRTSSKGKAIIAGIAKLEGQSVAFIAQEKGREVGERIQYNFGMPTPADYRKANRLYKLAEKFSLPVISLIDTPGAYPGVKAEQNNQSQAIAENLVTASVIKTPLVSCIIGEGGSGGALAIGIADHVMMLEYSIYSVSSRGLCIDSVQKPKAC